jgi:hypothetical protein
MSGPDKLYRWMDGAHVHIAAMAHPAYECTEYTRSDLIPDPHAIARAALEAAAKLVDCGCGHREAVLSDIHGRWAFCGEPSCGAIEADAIRAIMDDPAALAEILKGVKG